MKEQKASQLDFVGMSEHTIKCKEDDISQASSKNEKLVADKSSLQEALKREAGQMLNLKDEVEKMKTRISLESEHNMRVAERYETDIMKMESMHHSKEREFAKKYKKWKVSCTQLMGKNRIAKELLDLLKKS